MNIIVLWAKIFTFFSFSSVSATYLNDTAPVRHLKSRINTWPLDSWSLARLEGSVSSEAELESLGELSRRFLKTDSSQFSRNFSDSSFNITPYGTDNSDRCFGMQNVDSIPSINGSDNGKDQ